MTAQPPTIKPSRQDRRGAAAAPEEYQDAVRKIVISHAVNELYGAQVFDEPAIALAPTPYAKWLTCRVAMEEYGHHVRFRELGEQIGMPAEKMMPGEARSRCRSSNFRSKSWEEFCVIKLLADLAEILQVEDLLHCTFHPLRNLARMTMPEERFHAQFGKDFCLELCRTPAGRAKVQDAIDRYFPMLPRLLRRQLIEEQRDLPPAGHQAARATRRCAPISLSAPVPWWKMN